MNLPDLLEKIVEIRECIRSTRDGESEEICYRGTVEVVGGTMIKIVQCTIVQQLNNRPAPKEMWFDTKDETFQDLKVV